jgi:mevalonate pyrophosphate decarboxylase
MTTATAQAFSNIAFIKYWGIATENIAVVTHFCMSFGIQNRG